MREKRSVLGPLALTFLTTLALGTKSEGALPYAKYVCPNDLTEGTEYDGESDGLTYEAILELKGDYKNYPPPLPRGMVGLHPRRTESGGLRRLDL